MKHEESVWLNIIGVLLILLGQVMFVSPKVTVPRWRSSVISEALTSFMLVVNW
jgi:hypothetical protein